MQSKIIVKPVCTRRDYITFVKFPFKLYRKNCLWVPPLIIDELNTLMPSRNPVYKNADAELFLAFQNNVLVGRIAIIINWLEVNKLKKRRARFGWYDVIDDISVSRVLFDQVEKFAHKHKAEIIEGPMGFSNFEKAGLLTYGYDKMPTMATLYNNQYYVNHLRELGFKESLKWVEYEIDYPDEEKRKVLKKFSDLIKKRYKLKIVKLRSSKEVIPYLYELFELIEASYKLLETYVPIEKSQIENYKNRFLKFISPEYIKLVINNDGKLVAFSVTIPSLEKALIKAKGKLYPLGIFYLTRALRKNNKAAFYLIGIHPLYLGKGIPSIIFDEMATVFSKNGIQTFETNPELETNIEVQQLWKRYEPRIHKKRATFSRVLSVK